MEQLPTILGALILAGILWIMKTVQEHSVSLAEIKRTLTGTNGDNGVVGDVKALRARAHDHGDALHTLIGRADMTDLRLHQIDERLSA